MGKSQPMWRAVWVAGLLCITPACYAGLLLAIYDQATQQAPTLLAATQEREAALAQAGIARAGLLPQVGVEGGYGRLRVDTTDTQSPFIQEQRLLGNVTDAGVRLVQPVLDLAAWERWAQFEQTRARAELDFLVANQQMILEVAQRYLLWLEAVVALDYAVAHLQAMEQQRDQFSSRLELGLATAADLALVEAERDAAAADEIAAAAALRSAREGIRELLGRVPDVPTRFASPIPVENPQPASPEPWVEQALDANPLVAAARIQRDLARSELRERKRSLWPKLSLEAEHAYNDTSEFQLGREAQNSRIELRVGVPVFDGGATLARVRVADHVLGQRDAELLAARREAERATRDAYDGVVTGVVQLAASRRALGSAQAAVDAQDGRYRSGLATLADQLTVRGQERKALSDLAKARHRYLLSRLRLAAAVGSLGRADLAAVDALLQPRP